MASERLCVHQAIDPVADARRLRRPSATQSCERRTTTTVATQALQLLNDEFTNEQAEDMAARVIRETGDSVSRQVERVYWLALSRQPTDAERRTAAEFVDERFDSERRQLLDKHINLTIKEQGGAPPPRSGRFVPRDF